MEQFAFVSAKSEAQAADAAARSATAQIGASVRYVAGGTNLVDLMKLDVERPKQVVDINALELSKIEPLNGGLRIGALARNSDVANDATVKRDYAVLSEAILSGASPQIRNMASTAGNLVQRTRCPYFRDLAHKCNKRDPGSGCDAMEGHNRMLAILGTSEHCIATNPSDQNVALMALDAVVDIRGVKGERSVPIAEFYKLPGDDAAYRDGAGAGGFDYCSAAAGTGGGCEDGIFEAEGSCGVRVCASVRGDCAECERRRCDACARGAGWCGDGSVESS